MSTRKYVYCCPATMTVVRNQFYYVTDLIQLGHWQVWCIKMFLFLQNFQHCWHLYVTVHNLCLLYIIFLWNIGMFFTVIMTLWKCLNNIVDNYSVCACMDMKLHWRREIAVTGQCLTCARTDTQTFFAWIILVLFYNASTMIRRRTTSMLTLLTDTDRKMPTFRHKVTSLN